MSRVGGQERPGRPPLELRLLGPFELRQGDAIIPLPRRKNRLVLAALALRAQRSVPAEVLIGELWGEIPPRTAREALHNYVSQLRKEIGPEALQTREHGYLLAFDPERVDVVRFERLLSDARTADSVGDRAAKLQEAVGLWRGPPLADLSLAPFALRERHRLQELYVDAREELIDAELQCGSAARLIAELESLVAEHPLRERLTGHLMLALYRSGRQADALELYRRTHRTFVELLGISPGPGLKRLEQAILCHDASLERSAEDASGGLQPWPELRRVVAERLVGQADALLSALGEAADRARRALAGWQREPSGT